MKSLLLSIIAVSSAMAGAFGSELVGLAEASGVQGGIVVLAGFDKPGDLAELRLDDSYVVQGLHADSSKVDEARAYLAARNLNGPVSATRFDGRHLPFIDNLVNLVLVETGQTLGKDEILRALVPGGVAYVHEEGTWERMDKERTRSLDDWTHFLYDASNNPVAKDDAVGPPSRMQWISEPAWSKHHEAYPPTIPMMVSADGRVFYFEETSPASMANVKARWFLTARDAFNGTLLWRRQTPGWLPDMWPGDLGGGLGGGPIDYKRRLIAVGDKVYVTLAHTAPVTELDAATGEILRTICPGAEHVELLCVGDTLYVVSGSKSKDRLRLAADATTSTGLQLAAYDLGTGKERWRVPGGEGAAVSDGRVFFMAETGIAAVDARTGEPLWGRASAGSNGGSPFAKSAPRNEPLRAGAGVVLYQTASGVTTALSAETGKVLWEFTNLARHTGSKYMDTYIIDGLVWVTGVEPELADDRLAVDAYGLDPATGKVVASVPSGPVWNTGHHRRCYPGKATENFIIYSRRGAEFLDLESAAVGINHWTRGSCGYGVMPSNGLLYSPPHSCRCYSEAALRGLCAFAPANLTAAPPRASVESRLERGPAYGERGAGANGGAEADWPTFRHDGKRSAATAATLSSQLQTAWETSLGGRLSSPTIAEGKVFVALVDAHAVQAVDASTGKALWRYTAGGRVDTPPTIQDGLAVFGCADGWVYCVRTSDGALVWRFQAAPQDLRMGAYGQIESVWPVHGAVLVQGTTVYFAAGRSSYLDGGIYVYGLDLGTGEMKYQHRLDGPHDDAGMTKDNPSRGFVMPGALPDVLVSDGTWVYMRHMMFDPELQEATDMEPNYYAARDLAGEEFGGDHKYWCDLYESGKRAFVGKPEWYFRSYFNNYPGKRLYSTVGLLDASWHIRSYWSYGQVVGQNIVFSGDQGYAVRAFPNAARWLWYEAGQGYELYAGAAGAPSDGEPVYALKQEEHAWTTTLALRPQAMVLANDTLFIAGPPDDADPERALAAIEGALGARLWAVSAKDGAKLSELQIDSLPVFDGLAVAGSRLYVTTSDGRIRCFEGG